MLSHLPYVSPALALACFFALIPALWPCAALASWLLCHLTGAPRRYRKARGVPRALADAAGTLRHPRAKPEWVRRKVIYLATHLDSCRQVTHAFNRWHLSTSVGRTWVAEVMKGHATEIAAATREMRRAKPAAFAVNHTWALDFTFIVSPDGFTFTVLGIIDHGSRRLLRLKALPGRCAFLVLGHLFLTIARFGAPTAIRTDNESIFTSRLWRIVLRALGIGHRRGPPCQPWRNRRIERLFGTLKPLLRKVRPLTSESLQRALDEFTAFYNRARPHQSLGGLTPAEAWVGKSLADVRLGHSYAQGRWVQALGGLMVGYHTRR